jgi:hypothetical protein
VPEEYSIFWCLHFNKIEEEVKEGNRATEGSIIYIIIPIQIAIIEMPGQGLSKGAVKKDYPVQKQSMEWEHSSIYVEQTYPTFGIWQLQPFYAYQRLVIFP